MNSDYSNRADRDENRGFKTHRSERYRHPEQDSSYHFDDYGSSARGGYGNESHTGTWGNQGNEMGGSRNTSNQGMSDTYSTSRNYGNMGSYGGAQGFGDSRGGYSSQRERGHEYDSGMGSRDNSGQGRRRSYGYESDYDSHGSGYKYDSHPDLYGSDTSRRFQGSSGQGRYDFDRDNYNQGSGSFRSSDRDRNRGRDYRGSSSSSNYGGSQGSYMGSGYNRSSNRDYNSGNYGSMGSYDSGSSDRSYGESSDSIGYRGSRHTEYPNDTYARDADNNRIQHRDSDYDYDPNRSFNARKDPYYITSHNRNRTWTQDRDRDRNNERY